MNISCLICGHIGPPQFMSTMDSTMVDIIESNPFYTHVFLISALGSPPNRVQLKSKCRIESTVGVSPLFDQGLSTLKGHF